MLFWQMAWRNVWRYRRRSLLTVLTIALGLAFNILMRGIGDGFHEQMVDNSVRAGIGHIEIHRSGYQRDPALLKTLPDFPLLERVVPKTPHLLGYSFRVLGDGLASTAENSTGVRIIGIVPNAERTVTTIDRAVIAGEFLDDHMSRPVLIGDRLAQSLGASLNDKIVLVVQAADGSMGAQLFRVAGIFRSGSPDLDRGVVYLLRQDAQSLFSLANGITEAALLLDSSESVAGAEQFLTSLLASAPVEVLPWYTVEPFLRQFIQLDDAFFYIIVLILFIVISVGILNTVMMSVFERVREFGVMMALGTKPRQVVRLVMQESTRAGLARRRAWRGPGQCGHDSFCLHRNRSFPLRRGRIGSGNYHYGDPSGIDAAEPDRFGPFRGACRSAGGTLSGNQGGTPQTG